MNSRDLLDQIIQLRKTVNKNSAGAESIVSKIKNELRDQNAPDEILLFADELVRTKTGDELTVSQEELIETLLNTVPNADLEKCNLQVYRALLPITKLMFAIEDNGIAEEHAYKLSVIFETDEKAINYLRKFSNSHPKSFQLMYDANIYALPKGNVDLKTWRKLCDRNMDNADFRNNILPLASEIEKLIKLKKSTANNSIDATTGKKIKFNKNKVIEKINEIKDLYTEFRKLDRKPAPLSPQDSERHEALNKQLYDKRMELVELGIPFNHELEFTVLTAFREKFISDSQKCYKYFLDNKLTPNDFNKFLSLDRQNAGTLIPDIKINGEKIGYPGYYLIKIPVGDEMHAARAACLGKLTHNCQSLSGEAGEGCVIHGLTNPRGGFYVLCHGDLDHLSIQDQVIAQSWTWRSESDAIVFDSVESHGKTPQKTLMIKKFYDQLAKEMIEKEHTNKVVCGERKNVSEPLGFGSSVNPLERFTNYIGYTDAKLQKVIYEKECPYYFYGQDPASTEATHSILTKCFQSENLSKDEHFSKMLNWILLDWPSIKNPDIILTKIKEISNEHNRLAEVEELIDYANRYIQNKLNPDELLEAVKNEKLNADMINKDGLTILSNSIKSNRTDVALHIADYCSNINKQNRSGSNAFMVAIEQKNTDLCLRLIENYPKLNLNSKGANNATALSLAAQKGLYDVCKILIEKGLDVNSKDTYGYTPLEQAIEWGTQEVSLLLIQSGADVHHTHRDENTMLLIAANAGKADVCSKLIELGLDVNAKDSTTGQTPLMAASKKGNKAICSELIANHAEINAKDKSGHPAISYAIREGYIDVVTLLMDCGADIKGLTPLIDSVKCYNYKHEHRNNLDSFPVCFELIKRGCDINEQDVQGDTPLILAAKGKKYNLCKLLVDHGSDVNILNIKGESALFTAAKWQNVDVCLLLINAGATINEMALNQLKSLNNAEINEAISQKEFIDKFRNNLLHKLQNDNLPPQPQLASQKNETGERRKYGLFISTETRKEQLIEKIKSNNNLSELVDIWHEVNRHDRQSDDLELELLNQALLKLNKKIIKIDNEDNEKSALEVPKTTPNRKI